MPAWFRGVSVVVAVVLPLLTAACGSSGPTAQQDDVACAKNDEKACERRLGRMIAACEQKDTRSCVDVADAYFAAIHAPKDATLATKYFEKACDLGDGRACHMMASARFSGTGAPRDVALSQTLQEKACTLGYADACKARGKCLEDGSSFHGCPSKDLTKARELYARYCSLTNVAPEVCAETMRIDGTLSRAPSGAPDAGTAK